MATNYKICKKSYIYDFYKTPYEHNFICSKTQKCDTYIYRAAISQCVTKKYYIIYFLKKGKYIDYEKFPPKCTTNSK